MKPLVIALSAISLMPNLVEARYQIGFPDIVVSQWDREKKNTAITRKYDYFYKADVTSSLGGHQSLYLYIMHGDGRMYKIKDSCNRYNYHEPGDIPHQYSKRSVWKINGQPVKVVEVCSKYSDMNNYFIYAYPYTKLGVDFTINSFKKEKESVTIEGAGHKFKISAKGFTKVWNGFGGDAI